MRVKTIQLSWFRGAGNSFTLDADLKNVVVYGANGAGKSSFADALEYIVRDGKVTHLIHKDIGRKQEKGIINTHRPSGSASSATITFDGGINVYANVSKNDILSFGSAPKEFVRLMQTWELERILLRQDEVARFVTDTPGGKYSVLLPFLGLEELESAADTVAKLSKQISDASELPLNRLKAKELGARVQKHFTDVSDASLSKALEGVANNYGIDIDASGNVFEIAGQLRQLLIRQRDALAPEISRHSVFEKILEEDLPVKLSAAIEKHDGIRGRIDALLDTRIEILKKSQSYGKAIDKGTTEIRCPACGRTMLRDDFEVHVNDELNVLKDLCSAREQSIEAVENLEDSLSRVLPNADDKYFSNWLAETAQQELREELVKLKALNQCKWHQEFSSNTQKLLSNAITTIHEVAKTEVGRVSPSTSKFIDDLDRLEVVTTIPRMRSLEKKITIASQIVIALDKGALAIRETIRARTQVVISRVSKDIQYLWSKLHPDEPIEGVKLYIPKDEDKSIDVGLKFHGVDQPSPRFTLSEGHRNSLGLCIFLALARLEKNKDMPIFLDDIVSSFDRQHRGNVTELLKSEFGNRQILLFTHDREWFTELSLLLPPKLWKKLVLKPWKNPSIGMQWSTSEFSFDDARDYMDSNCELAGNCVRQIMDAQLAIAAEKLRVKVPYARGDRNDHRTCVEFLEYIISAAKRSLKIRNEGNEYVLYDAPVRYWDDTRRRLIVRADRASHTGSLVRDEVENLISVCEGSIGQFKCGKCGDFIWAANQESRGVLQCSCGTMNWKYD